MNIDMEYSIIVINVQECGKKNTSDTYQIIKDRRHGCRSTRIDRHIFAFKNLNDANLHSKRTHRQLFICNYLPGNTAIREDKITTCQAIQQ